MNAVRRKKLKESIDKLSAIKYSIENVRFQEEDALENIIKLLKINAFQKSPCYEAFDDFNIYQYMNTH